MESSSPSARTPAASNIRKHASGELCRDYRKLADGEGLPRHHVDDWLAKEIQMLRNGERPSDLN